MPSKKTFFITTSIPYVNAVPHLGHAMEFVETDTIARYKRMKGLDTVFLTGTDEHGVKIFKAAKEAGVDTKAFVDGNVASFLEIHKLLQVSNDDFIRTTDRERHWPACQKLWNTLLAKGDIYEKEYEGLYCEGCEAFYLERDLNEGKCPTHLKPVSILKEKNYFFRLSKYSEQIKKILEEGQVRIIPEFRKHEILNVVTSGLHDVSFSRPRSVLPWGVDVPNDPDQVMYVWCDALTNYISAIGYADNDKRFKKYWPANLHVIGKDIVRFHAGIWIGMLLSAQLPLPEAILVHGFITHNGQKMSKTLGNVVDPKDVASKYGADALRYYLLREIPIGKDGDFNDTLFVERYNSDLASNLGNLLNRVHTLISRNQVSDFSFDKDTKPYEEKISEVWKKYTEDMDRFDLYEAVHHIWRLVDFGNKQMEEEKPWKSIKEAPEKGRATLCNLLELLRHVSLMISPMLPMVSAQIRIQLGLPEAFDLKKEGEWGAIKGWKGLGEAKILFPRFEA